jgi:predicted ABC-type sugar transport system permease subunit
MLLLAIFFKLPTLLIINTPFNFLANKIWGKANMINIMITDSILFLKQECMVLLDNS